MARVPKLGASGTCHNPNDPSKSLAFLPLFLTLCCSQLRGRGSQERVVEVHASEKLIVSPTPRKVMVLNIRQKQRDAIFRMLNFNEGVSNLKQRSSEEGSSPYKILVLDSFSKLIIAPLVSVQDLRQRGGVTLHLSIEASREPIPDVPAVYFVRATADNVQRLLKDAEQGLYDTFYLNFTAQIPRPLLENLAEGAVKRLCAQRVSKVFDQYLSFIALESNMFSLGLPNSYLELNDPAAKDTQIEASTAAVVEGLFSALATLGAVPIIRCPKGGAAQHVASQLDQRIRDHLKQRNNLFTEAAAGLVTSVNRPLLCLFDRNFELSVVLQHTWTYKPLVHDVLNMDLNRITVEEAGSKPALPGAAPAKKSFEVGDGDFFWESHGRAQFPKVAAEVDAQIVQYKQAIEEINSTTGANMDPNADPNELMQQTTRGLMAAVSRLPQLTDRKRTLDKHTNLLHHLLREIQARGLDQFYNAEEDLLVGKGDIATMERLLQDGKGRPEDKLRLALVYLLTAEPLPSDADFSRMEAALGSEAAGGFPALRYVRRMRRMNLTGKSAATAAAAAGAEVGGLPGLANVSQSNLLSWAGTFGQGLTSLTKGVKNLLAGEQQAAVTVAVEGLMEARPVPELDAFATFDPRAQAGRPATAGGPFKEAIVFLVGGGNYLEAESLATWASRAQPPKNVIYGATALLTGEQFAAQLCQLGRLSGAV